MENFITSQEAQGIVDVLNKCLKKKDTDAQILRNENNDLRETVCKLTLEIEEYKRKLNDFEIRIQVMEQNSKESASNHKNIGKDEVFSSEISQEKSQN